MRMCNAYDLTHRLPFEFLSAVLDRLDAFLPSMRTANEDLERRAAQDPSSINVEHVEDEEQEHIAMVRTQN